MANKEMKTIQFPNSEIVYEIVDNAAREALAGKQPAGNYATTEALNAHTGNTNNPHTVTKAQVGLENVANERQYSSQNPPPYPVSSVAGKTGIVTLNKSDVQLGNVDNTADMDKPVSTAQSTAINAKYTKPASGIPETDLAADVQTSLGKADSAYQKPSTGIPKADLSEEVRNALDSILNTAFVDVVLNGSTLEFKNAKGAVVKTVELPEPDEPDKPTVDGNLLTAPVSFNSMAMTDTFSQIDYSLGLKLDNTYTINVTIDGEAIVIDDQPGIPSVYPNSTRYYGGVTLGNIGGEAITGNLSDGRMYMLMVMDKAGGSGGVADINNIVYDPNKTSFMCMVMNGDDGTSSPAVPVTVNSIVLKTTVPDERLTAPVTIPAQSTSKVTGLTVQGELNLGTEATIDSPNPSVLYKIEGTIGGQDFTSFLVGGRSSGQYYPFGIYGTTGGGGATACDDGILDDEGPDWQCGITGIAMNAEWSGTDFVAATGSWAIRVEALVDEAPIIRGTPEIVINSIKRMNLPNILTADIEMSNHIVAEGYTTPYYGEVTKPEGVSLEAGARYILVTRDSTSQDQFCATGVAKAAPDKNNCIEFEGYSAYRATATNKLVMIGVVDGALYKAPTDDTQEYDPTKWTFYATVDSPVTAFYLAKVE